MINSFSTFLVEEEKTLYFVWGRMNPPTAGHEKLLDFLKAKAGRNPFRIYLTQSEDNSKNPIPFTDKIKFARKGFPQYGRQIMMNKKLKTIFDAMTSFYNEGFKRIVIVAGNDRVRQYEILLNKYNGVKGKHGFYNFEKINVLDAGKRDPESTGVEGVSGTKLRGYAESGEFTKFAQYMPKRLSNSDSKAVYNAVRKGIGLKEEKEFKNKIQLEPVSDLRESYVSGELYKVGDQVIIKDTEEIAEVKVCGANYVIVETANGQYRKWLEAIEPMEEGLWANIRARRAAGKPKKKPGQKGYPKTLDIESAAYHKGVSKSTSDKRKAHFNKNAKKADNDPSAYKPAPGDKTAKTKTSVHTKRFKQMFGEDEMQAIAKKRIEREKEIDKIKHDRMMDRARTRDTRAKNRETP